MIKKMDEIKHLIGNTPMRIANVMNIKLGIKLEFLNLFGSIKDRPAFNIIYHGIKNGQIGTRTTIVESSSGNLAISLANICKHLGLNFIPVVDPNINSGYLQLLQVLCTEVVTVYDKDMTDGYLINRINKVKSICSEIQDAFWTNQYGNPYNYLSYYHGLANEALVEAPEMTHFFIAVSSAGTLAGISRRLKEVQPGIKIIAVDIEGSVIFDQQPKSRHISGLGSSIVPPLLSHALYDEVIHVTHEEIIAGCKSLYNDTLIFGGGSAGATYSAIKKYFSLHIPDKDPFVIMCCPDRGNGYTNTIYNKDWCYKTETEDIDYAVLK